VLLSVLVPTYNEEKTIVKVIEGIKKVVNIPYEIIVIDDGSTDRTAELVKTQKVFLIPHPQNCGYSSALKSGLRAAKGDYVLIIDGDNTYPTDAIPSLLEHIPAFDMVVGARQGGNTPLLRRPAKIMLGILANYLANTKIPDLNSGLRVFKKDLAMEFMHLYPPKWSFTVTITLAFFTNGYTIKYVPINYLKREAKSTVKATDFVDFINLILRITTYFNPFKIFSTVSAFLMLFAFLIFLYSSLLLHKIMDVTIVVITLTALQVFLSGLIADLIVKSRRV